MSTRGLFCPVVVTRVCNLTAHLKIKSAWSYTSTKMLRLEERCKVSPLTSYLFNGRMELKLKNTMF
jgi:hypothetical protein